MRYGEKIIKEFNPQNMEIWDNKNTNDYVIKITLPEFICFCPRSGYPDFATIHLIYVPNKKLVELKDLKIYINSFINKYISHEDSINEIYSTLDKLLEPKYLRVVGDFNPRGNVHTVIEVDSNLIRREKFDISAVSKENLREF